ncbi:MAG TPA: zinc-binding dehydrogenase [Planctomycetota bacterium]|nr:zinc-binding dehydrogenase [Planctomycetota bacterium]
MRAAVFEGPGKPLALRDLPTPEPKPGEVLVRVAACGICHTDLHFLDHGVPTAKAPPLVLGHEASGTVEALGEGVTSPRPGDRVLLPAVYGCGRCRFCRGGRENLCASLVFFGSSVDGAFAEFLVAPADVCFPVPEGIPLDEVAIVADAVSTPFHAVKNRARVRPGETVAVFGCGGVGMNVVQCSLLAGARVFAVDLDPAKLALAREFGAEAAVDAGREREPARAVRRLADGGVDVAFEAIGNPATIRAACDSLRRGGRLCVIGFTAAEVPVPAGRVMFHELEIVGSLGCPTSEVPPLLGLVRTGKVRLAPLVTARLPLERIREGFDRARRGEGLRTVVIP